MNKQHPFKSILLKFYPSIHFPLLRIGQTSFSDARTRALPLGSRMPGKLCYPCSVLRLCPRVSFLLDVSRMPLQESVRQASWSDVEPFQAAPCEDCQPCTNPPINVPLSLVYACKHGWDTWTILHLGQKHSQPKGHKPPSSLHSTTASDFEVLIQIFQLILSQIGCFCYKSHGDTVDTANFSLRLDAAGWWAHQDEWQVLRHWGILQF